MPGFSKPGIVTLSEEFNAEYCINGGLPFTTSSNPTYPYTAGDTICSADLDNNGNIEISEIELFKWGAVEK